MKQTAFCILAVFFCGIAFAQPVSEDVAQRVAMNFVNRHSEKPAGTHPLHYRPAEATERVEVQPVKPTTL